MKSKFVHMSPDPPSPQPSIQLQLALLDMRKKREEEERQRTLTKLKRVRKKARQKARLKKDYNPEGQSAAETKMLKAVVKEAQKNMVTEEKLQKSLGKTKEQFQNSLEKTAEKFQNSVDKKVSKVEARCDKKVLKVDQKATGVAKRLKVVERIVGALGESRLGDKAEAVQAVTATEKKLQNSLGKTEKKLQNSVQKVEARCLNKVSKLDEKAAQAKAAAKGAMSKAQALGESQLRDHKTLTGMAHTVEALGASQIEDIEDVVCMWKSEDKMQEELRCAHALWKKTENRVNALEREREEARLKELIASASGCVEEDRSSQTGEKMFMTPDRRKQKKPDGDQWSDQKQCQPQEQPGNLEQAGAVTGKLYCMP